MSNYILTLDIGGSSIKYATCDNKAQLSNNGSVTVPASYEEELKTIFDIYNQFPNIEGIAISMPGRVDSRRGFVYSGGALSFNAQKYFASDISKICNNVPCSIENDGKAAARAELWIGNLKNVTNGLVIVLGTATGGGIIIDGKVYSGSFGGAGEFSFIIENKEKALNHQKTQVMTATSVSATGLLIEYCKCKNLDYCVDFQKGVHFPLTGKQFFEVYNNGDQKAKEALNNFAQNCANLIFNLAVTLNIEKVAIGGGISAQPAVCQAISEALNNFYVDFNIPNELKQAITMPDITPCKFFNDANLIGAAHCYSIYIDPKFFNIE